ncbi:flagellar motor switch phosphatase FliY [Alicyclobacillaceae bacterium I2511]|nr:flagellar motor switch phosphatase FliY [Alicyclobacillaceae bacterium I2511]
MNQRMNLSQEEIDALLKQGEQPSPTVQGTLNLSEMDRDTLGEIGNISFGSAATTLSTLLSQRVEITTPAVSVLGIQEVQRQFHRPYVLVTVQYTAGLHGTNALVIELNDAKTIADLMMGGNGRNVAAELTDLHLSAVAEAMNQMMGSAATAMSNMFGTIMNISPPSVQFIDLATDAGEIFDFSGPLVNVSFQLKVGDLIDSTLMQWLPWSFASYLLHLANSISAKSKSLEGAPPTAQSNNHQIRHARENEFPDGVEEAVGVNHDLQINSRNSNFGQSTLDSAVTALTANSSEPNKVLASTDSAGSPSLQKPEFVSFDKPDPVISVSARNLQLLYDVRLNVTVELGHTQRTIREVLEMVPGSVIELDKLAGEPVDILVNGRAIAVGEVVVVDENFGVRVTNILSPAERVRQLQ